MSCIAAEPVSTLNQFLEVVHDLGYDASLLEDQDAILVSFNVNDTAFPAVITRDAESNDFRIDCEYCKLETIYSEDATEFTGQLVRLLMLNHEIAPFAFSLVDDSDDGLDPTDSVNLVHSIPIGDLSAEEIDAAFSSLRSALNAAEEINS